MAIRTKIDFLHDARPYALESDYENLYVDFPDGQVPSKGDIVYLHQFRHPNGAYEVAFRHFEILENGKVFVSITLKVEGQ